MRKVFKPAMLGISSLLFVCMAWAEEVQIYTNRQIKPVVLELLNYAEESIDVEMYVLTHPDVLAALERAEARGVEVRVILDPNQPSNQRHIDQLKQHGVEVKWFPVSKPALMHRKLAIIDDTQVLLGSANWTANGLDRNEEVVVLIDDPTVVRHLQETFSDDWYHSWLGDYARY